MFHKYVKRSLYITPIVKITCLNLIEKKTINSIWEIDSVEPDNNSMNIVMNEYSYSLSSSISAQAMITVVTILNIFCYIFLPITRSFVVNQLSVVQIISNLEFMWSNNVLKVIERLFMDLEKRELN